MRYHVQRLAALAGQPVRRIIGLMSGTSLDGLDVVLCNCSGSGTQTRVAVERFMTVPYDEAFKTEIRRVFAKKEVEFQHLTLLNVVVAERQAAIVLDCLRQWQVAAHDVDLIASHGQTVFHAPRIFHGLAGYPNATLQIGDGDHLAVRTGILTISDFRQKHLAAGGEGAPLALYGDYFLFSQAGEDRFLLNLGGIANFTFLPGDSDPAKAFATDTGPGNTLLDAFARALFDVAYDADALLASAGMVEPGLLDQLYSDAFFAASFPKTSGPEYFNAAWVETALRQLPKGHNNPYNLLATLTKLTADTVAGALLRVPLTVGRPALYISGGGAHNPLIRKYLQENLPDWPIHTMDMLGIDGDAKEAVLFAVLANETVAGSNSLGKQRLGGLPLVGMGKISFPS
ncbi:MAG: anhydro-N-acetylmuramic acid kinase [Saprospiraceae bacterium]